MSNRIFVYIDGNIGSGKTSTIKDLANKFNFIFPFYENIEKWIKEDLLQKYYTNMGKYAYDFQSEVLKSRVEQYNTINKISAKNKDVFLFERSLQSNKDCFANRLYKKGLITYTQWEDYLFYYNSAKYNIDKNIHQIDMKPKNGIIYIYIYTPPKICLERIKSRGRISESGIELEFLEEIDEYHKKMLGTMRTNKIAPIILDGRTETGRLSDKIYKLIEPLRRPEKKI
jgi:deoxyadenosine/deoxycytidine kinase